MRMKCRLIYLKTPVIQKSKIIGISNNFCCSQKVILNSINGFIKIDQDASYRNLFWIRNGESPAVVVITFIYL